jgi:hypothetical protein
MAAGSATKSLMESCLWLVRLIFAIKAPAPELMVEVLSPGKLNEQRDREIKLKLYSLGNGLDLLLIFWEGALRAPSQKINNRFETLPLAAWGAGILDC